MKKKTIDRVYRDVAIDTITDDITDNITDNITDDELRGIIEDMLIRRVMFCELLDVGRGEEGNIRGEIMVKARVRGRGGKRVGIYRRLKDVVRMVKEVTSNTVSTTTLCFISDASGGSGSSLIHSLSNLNVSIMSGAVVVGEGCIRWMESLCMIRDEGGGMGLGEEGIKDATSALTLLGTSVSGRDVRLNTVIVPIPDAGVAGVMHRICWECYPHDRHVIVYDDAKRAVGRRVGGGKIINTYCYRGLGEGNEALRSNLSNLRSVSTAMSVECWLGLLDGVLSLKDSTENNPAPEKKDGETKEERKIRRTERERLKRMPHYTPFVFRCGYVREPPQPPHITTTDGPLTTEYSDASEGRILYVTNLMQYVTGRRKDNVDEDPEKVRSIVEEWVGREDGYYRKFEGWESDVIEECAFSCKRVLLSDKVVLDTVVPRREWSLKQRRKVVACACCAPFGEEDDSSGTDDDDDGDDEEGRGDGDKMWMDGKSGFAFDPERVMRRLGRRGVS